MGGILKGYFLVTALVFMLVSLGGRRAAAQVHHVVGGDRGWDPSSDVGAWSSGRVFRVGDKIWFTYSSARESIAEVSSKEEFESCNVSNPIRMYTDGLNRVSLDGEGTRYFASGSPDSCKTGLKLNVEVMPQAHTESQMTGTMPKAVVATGPTPSASARLEGVSSLLWPLWVGLVLLCFLGFV